MKNVLILILLVGIVGGLVFVFYQRHPEAGGGEAQVRIAEQRALEPDKEQKTGQDQDSDSESDKDANTKREQKSTNERDAKDRNAKPGENEAGIKLGEKEQSLGGIVTASLQGTTQRPELQALGSVVDIQELIDFRSAFINATAQLKKAESALSVAQAEFERQKLLHNQNQNVSEKVFQSAQDAFNAEQANHAIAIAAIATVETNALQHWGAKIAEEFLHDTDEGQRLLQREAFLVQITFPAGTSVLEPPQETSVRNSSGDSIEGNFVSLSPRTDPKLQGRSFFYLIPSHHSAPFVPGMSVSAMIPIGESEPAVVVPLSAVVWLHGKAWAYVAEEPDRFVRREVSTDRPTSDGWLESPDFTEDHPVVVHGAQALLSQESQSQIQVGEEGDEE